MVKIQVLNNFARAAHLIKLIFVQFFAQVAIYNQKSNFASASKCRQIS